MCRQESDSTLGSRQPRLALVLLLSPAVLAQEPHPQTASQRHSGCTNRPPALAPGEAAGHPNLLRMANPLLSPAQYRSPGWAYLSPGPWTSPHQPPRLQLPSPSSELPRSSSCKSRIRARPSHTGNRKWKLFPATWGTLQTKFKALGPSAWAHAL